MNLDTPRCVRCERTRFLHARRVVDANEVAKDSAVEWKLRPVAAVRVEGDSDHRKATGRFETLTCRHCGLTAWYACDWRDAPGKAVARHCLECDDETTQRSMPAVEHDRDDIEQAIITRGMLGREGKLSLFICSRCDRASWSGSEYGELDRSYFVSYMLRASDERACLVCDATDALVDNYAREFSGNVIPVALAPRSWLFGLVTWMSPVGHFVLRLCRPCGGVEWYAADPGQLEADPRAELFAIGDAATVTHGGPYR